MVRCYFAEPFLVSVVGEQEMSGSYQLKIGSGLGVITSLSRARKDRIAKIADLGQALINRFYNFSFSTVGR